MDCNCTVAFPGPSGATCGGTTIIMFMAILEKYLRSQCDIEDPCGQINPTLQPATEYDFIVVGGGTAGSVVANRLSEVPGWRVLLVEAGANEPTGGQVPSLRMNFVGSSIDWNYKTEPEDMACLAYPGRICTWPRGKVIGGTSALGGMIYLRGNKRDFDYWQSLGNEGWSYRSILPYFLKSENNLQPKEVDRGYHSIGGELPVSYFPYRPGMVHDILQSAQELGQKILDVNGKQQTGFTINQSTSRNGIRYSASRSFLRPVKNRKNLDVMLNTTVTRVLLNPGVVRAQGIEVITSAGKKIKISARNEVIICAGVIGSPQILLLSGIGDKDELQKVGIINVKNLSGVGKNLHDQVSFLVGFTINETSYRDLNYDTAFQYLLFRDGPMSAIGISQASGFINSKYANSSDDYPDVQISYFGYSADCSRTGAVDEISGQVVNGTLPKRPILIVPTLLRPESRGYLTLRDNNPLSHPKIYANYLKEYDDVARLIEGIKFSINVSETEALNKYGFQIIKTPAKGCENLTFGSDEYWECAVRANTYVSHHQVGTCKMGPSIDPLAVVDAQLKVHGVENLRVIDASIMPSVTSGKTLAPVIAVAEKGSDMVKKRWLRSSFFDKFDLKKYICLN